MTQSKQPLLISQSLDIIDVRGELRGGSAEPPAAVEIVTLHSHSVALKLDCMSEERKLLM